MDAAMAVDPLAYYDKYLAEYFDFLISEYGYRLVDLNVGASYESEKMLFGVGYEPARRDKQIYMGLCAMKEQPVQWYPVECIYDNNRIAGRAHWPRTDLLVVTKPHDSLSRSIYSAALTLKCLGPLALSGDEQEWDTIRKLMAERTRQYNEYIFMAPILASADAAWIKKDFRYVCAILSPHRDKIGPREARRLAYAENQLLRAKI